MPTQTESGKAFEYSLAVALFEKIKSKQDVELVLDSSYDAALYCFNIFDTIGQNQYALASKSAVNHIVDLEPYLENPINSNTKLTIKIQPDQRGILGDARDIIVTNYDNDWQIGFSAKNNHTAVKHSRLSDKIDFGKKWFGLKCSQRYMDEVKQILGNIRKLVEEGRYETWNQLLDKEEEYYKPVLMAFKAEIEHMALTHSEVPSLLAKYIIGKYDFYKIMKYHHYTKIQGFNLDGTLNQKSGKIKARYKVEKLKLPTRLVESGLYNNNTLKMIFDNGWHLSFRIHNASTMLEPSLKFDVQLVGNPSSMYTDQESW